MWGINKMGNPLIRIPKSVFDSVKSFAEHDGIDMKKRGGQQEAFIRWDQMAKVGKGSLKSKNEFKLFE